MLAGTQAPDGLRAGGVVTCVRCGGYVFRDVYGDMSCINCGRQQTPGMAVDLEVIKYGGNARREPVMGKAGPACSECGESIEMRSKTGKCRACLDEARNQAEMSVGPTRSGGR